jgi:DNA-binding NtrC family response regulator
MLKTILLVEDNLRIRKHLAYFLRAKGYQVNEASTTKEAIEFLEKEVDLILSDIFMPDFTAFDFLPHIRSVAPGIPVLLMSGFLINAEQILKEGATDFIMKPFSLDDLLAKLKLALEPRP